MGPGRSPMANSCALSSSLERRTSSGGMGIGGDETSSGVELPDELHDLSQIVLYIATSAYIYTVHYIEQIVL